MLLQREQQPNTKELWRNLDKLPNVPQAAFNSYEKQYESLCLEDTRVEVLKEIRGWAEANDERRIFWLSGLAGTGKSTIARTVARESYEKGDLGASFFFSRGGGDLAHAGKFFTTIALQLAKKIPFVKTQICDALEKDGDIGGISLRDQWRRLIFTPLSKLDSSAHQSRLLIVIDALDECEGESDIRVLLQLLADTKEITTLGLRIFITSRPETPLRLGFRQMPIILHHDLVLDDISRKIVDRDILTFLKQQFGEIRDIFEEVSPDWPSEERLSLLVAKAEGLFIYAATVCRFLKGNDQWPPEDLLSIFIPLCAEGQSKMDERSTPHQSPFSELDEIYGQILDQSLKRIGNPKDRAVIAGGLRRIVSTIAALLEPLSTISLSLLLGIQHTAVQRGLRHLRSVFNVPDDQGSPIRMLHPSFRDFLFDNQRCTDPHIFVAENEAHKHLAESCIRLLSKTLMQDICDVKWPGTAASDVERSTVQRCLPAEVQYASTYWAQHVLSSGIELCEGDWIHQFLKEHFLHWLEALSWIGKISEGIHALSHLESQISVGSR